MADNRSKPPQLSNGTVFTPQDVPLKRVHFTHSRFQNQLFGQEQSSPYHYANVRPTLKALAGREGSSDQTDLQPDKDPLHANRCLFTIASDRCRGCVCVCVCVFAKLCVYVE